MAIEKRTIIRVTCDHPGCGWTVCDGDGDEDWFMDWADARDMGEDAGWWMDSPDGPAWCPRHRIPFCDRCGRDADDRIIHPGWVFREGYGDGRWLCPDCVGEVWA